MISSRAKICLETAKPLPVAQMPRRAAGFTLIEVVVALSVVVVSFMALYGVILQMVSSTTLMQEKMFANWIAFDQITELRIQGDLPGDTKNSGVKEMGGQTWTYDVEVRATNSDAIRQVIVWVAPEAEPDRRIGLASGVLISNAPLTQAPPGVTAPPGAGNTPPVTSGASPDWSGR